MMETKYVGDKFEMLVTVLAFINIPYLLTFAFETNIQKMSPTSKNCHQHLAVIMTLKLAIFYDSSRFDTIRVVKLKLYLFSK